MNTPTRRLGRGLGSLIAGGGQSVTSVYETETIEDPVFHPTPSPTVPENTEKGDPENTPSSNHLQELLVEQVVPNPNQPRKVIDPEAIKELASSIQSEGLLQPIVVRPTESGY